MACGLGEYRNIKKSVFHVVVNQRALNAPLNVIAGQQKASGWNKRWNSGNNESNNIGRT